MTDITDQIETDALTPSSVSVDGQSVSARPLSELIEADKYLANKTAATSGLKGLVRQRMKPPSSLG